MVTNETWYLVHDEAVKKVVTKEIDLVPGT